MAERMVRISVRNFVEFMLRSGDIDNRKHVSSENAMVEGGRIHRMIQRRMGSEYEAEVFLKYEEETPDYKLVIDGRADGIITIHKNALEESDINYHLPMEMEPFYIDEQVTIDEIKGTYRELDKIKKPEPVHLAQAKVYAYIYGKEKELKSFDAYLPYG